MLLFGERLLKAPSQFNRKHSMLLSIVGLAAATAVSCGRIRRRLTNSRLGFGVYVLVLAVMRREWKGVVAVGGAMALGIGLAAVYLLPAAIEQNLIHKEFIAEVWPYHKTYIFVHDLYKTDKYSGFFKLIDAIWIAGTLIIAVGAITLLWLKRRVSGCGSRAQAKSDFVDNRRRSCELHDDQRVDACRQAYPKDRYRCLYLANARDHDPGGGASCGSVYPGGH